MRSEIITNQDGSFILFDNDAIAQHIKRGQRWESHFSVVVEKLISPGDTVIDCGANFGYNSVVIGKKLNNKGLLIAFEPQWLIYQQLNGNLILNNIFNSVTYNSAVGHINCNSNMRSVDYNSSFVNIGDTSIGEGGEDILMCRLDDLNISRVDFIKLDVQGYELFALQGASKLLSTCMPHIFIEIEDHQLDKFNISSSDLISHIKSLGYSIYRIDNNYPCDHICTTSNLDFLIDLLPLVKL